MMKVNFNKEQKQAIEFYKGACGVIAGAGSGKSTVLLNRIKNLIEAHDVKEEDILAITFTDNTYKELKNKLDKMGYINVNVGTFHKICGRILSKEGISINKSNLIKEWQIENIFKKIDKKANTKDILSFIGYQKSYLKSYNDEFLYKDSKYSEDELRIFFKEYENFKDKNNLFDFDDYLIKCYHVLKNNPNKYSFEFILVDEHQDSNLVQNLLLKELCKSGNIFCVFDFRQAIYTFRGGNPEYCMNFNKEWDNATIINLFTNYRSCENIVNNANNFISQYYGDYEFYKDSEASNSNNGNIDVFSWGTREQEGEEIVNHIEELIQEGKNPNDISVLYRLNSHADYVECELKRRNIPYYINNDSSFFKRTEINAVMSYLRLIHNLHDDGAFENIFKLRNYPLTYFSNKILEDIRTYAGLHDLSLYESFLHIKYKERWQSDNAKVFEDNIIKLKNQLLKGTSIVKIIDNISKVFKLETYIADKYTDTDEVNDRITAIETLKTFVKGNNLDKFIAYVYSTSTKRKETDGVKLMTVHSSKGLEFNTVYVIGIQDGKFPHEKSDVLDEARLFYVATTRAKENLYLSQIYDNNRFVEEYFN